MPPRYICKEVSDEEFLQNATFFKILESFHDPSTSPTYPTILGSTVTSLATDEYEDAPFVLRASTFQWDAFAVIKAMIFIAITLCTILGNGLVILAMILKRNTLKSSTHYFIGSLSLADLLVGILVMPFLAANTVTSEWYFGGGYCIAFHCIHYWLCGASILSITAICLERYVGVRYPLKHFKMMNYQRVYQTCGIVWLLTGLLSVVPLFVWRVYPQHNLDCPINFEVGHVVVVMVFMFYIPCGIMLGFYFRIYQIASAHLEAASARRGKGAGGASAFSTSDSGFSRTEKSGSKSSASTNITNISSNHSTSDYSHSESLELSDSKCKEAIISCPDETALNANRKKQANLSKKLALVVGAFFICYFPFFTAFMIKAIGLKNGNDPVPNLLFEILCWTRYFNSCLNPFIYASMLKPFREAFNDIFTMVGFRRK